MKKIALLLLFLSSFAFTKPYEPFEDKVISATDRKIQISYFFKAVDTLFFHARQYPLSFDNKNDETIAKTDLKNLLLLADNLKDLFEYAQKENVKLLSKPEQFYFDLSQARLFVIAHNFDMEGYAEKADAAYPKLLTEDKNGSIRTEYAEFLANSTNTERAIKEFQTAINEGSDRAYYGLALSYLTLGNRKESLKNMQKYVAKFPEDEHAKKMVEIIKTAKIKITTAP